MWNYVGEGNFNEKMMWLNVVRRAIFDYVLYRGQGRNEIPWKRAYAFLFLDDTEDEDVGMRFEEICGLLDWNIEYVRRLIKNMDRSSVRRLESSKFRHEFSTEFTPTSESSKAPEWEGSGVSVPFFRWLTYSRGYRQPLKPKLAVAISSTPVVGAAWSS